MHVDPFRRPYCPAAWRNGSLHRTPTWVRCAAARQLDTASVRELLERAQLPDVELRHMGAPAWLLSNMLPAPQWLVEERAVPLLGRIAWDASRGAAGGVWCGDAVQRLAADWLGRAVIREYFTL